MQQSNIALAHGHAATAVRLERWRRGGKGFVHSGRRRERIKGGGAKEGQ